MSSLVLYFAQKFLQGNSVDIGVAFTVFLFLGAKLYIEYSCLEYADPPFCHVCVCVCVC